MKILLLSLVTILITSCSVFGVADIEEPNYEVLLEEDNFQVRKYPDTLVAQTTTTGSYQETSSKGFERLAGYIFGDNVAKEKISMTAPVLREKKSEKIEMTAPVYRQQDDSDWIMTFVLPSEYTLDTAPTPNDKKVIVKQLPGNKVATLRYSGRMTEASLDEHTQKLENWVKEKDFSVIGMAYSAAYDPPWTLPMLRRNEIHIQIE
ncbi:MAG: heme-binding protein [Gammaproteobacteria bacterium]